jgi:two-component system response regulator AtoC
MVQNGTFRNDLYFRLNVAKIKVTALKERKSDIPLLVEHLLRKINLELNKGIEKVEMDALKKMMEYDWPGNVRELENILTHAAINTQGEVILEELITPLLGQKFLNPMSSKDASSREQTFREIEKEYIINVLNRTQWHLGKACEVLGISRPTLRHKLKEYEISTNPNIS